MGQYLQMGICYRMKIDKNRLDKLGISLEKLTNELNKHLDVSLYDLNETQDEIIFEIKESVLEQLQEFMRIQYSMYPQEQPYMDCYKSAVEIIGGLSSIQEIIQVAEEKNFPCFQSSKVTDEIAVSAWDCLRVDISLFVFFVEGKIFIEGYNSFLKYIENNVRKSSERWSLAGAFKCYID